MGDALYVQLFFHDLQHHPCSQLEAILEQEALRHGLELPDTVRIPGEQFLLLIRHGGFELFFIPAN